MRTQMLYLLSPSSKKDAHHVAHAHGIDKAEKDRKPNIAPAPVVTKDDEGTEVSEAEVRDSFKKSYVSVYRSRACV